MQRVKYVGPGGEIFPDLHWQPEPGEEAEFPEELLGDLTDHPRLRTVKAAAAKTDHKEG